jgi:hypothetical protein
LPRTRARKPAAVALPSKVKVGSAKYAVSFDPNMLDDFCKTQFKTESIILRPGDTVRVTRDTLLHEVLHTVTFQTNLYNELGDEKEESFVWRIAPVLLTVLRENPELVAYLLAEDGE